MLDQDHQYCRSFYRFALGVELDYQFDLRWLLCELKRVGLCFSPDEVTRLKQSVI